MESVERIKLIKWIKWTTFSTIRTAYVEWSNGVMLCVMLCVMILCGASRMDQTDQMDSIFSAKFQRNFAVL